MFPPDLILFLWPFAVILLFRFLTFKVAIVWSILAGYLLLPSSVHTSWNFPLLPPIDKRSVPALATAVAAVVVVGQMAKSATLDRSRTSTALPGVLPGWLPRSIVGQGLILMMAVGVVLTVQTNQEPLDYGLRELPGLRLMDIASTAAELGLMMILPLLIGRKFLADSDGHKVLLVALCISGAVYAALALYEVRMSPQLNTFFYGFFPHSWLQHIRGGGFRPLVFLDHGLRLGIYLACATVAAAVLVRIDGTRRFLYLFVFVWLFGALVLSKTLGALLIAAALVPIALFLPVRLQLLAAATAAMMVMTYPLLRSIDLVPTEEAVLLAERVHENRAGSLQYRFENEDILLEKARERPVFGWGGWARARVFDEEGNDISTTDGAWVILIGETGWVGYIAQFGLLTIPVMLLAFRGRRDPVDPATAGLALVLAAILLDLIPNSPTTAVLFLIAGALMGRLEIAQSQLDALAQMRANAQPTRHTRFAANKPRGGDAPVSGTIRRDERRPSQASRRSSTIQ